MERLAIGRVRSPYGVAGHVKVHSYSGETKHFMSLCEVNLVSGKRERPFHVEEVRLISNSVLLKLAGIDSPEEARRYSGWELWVDRSFAAELREGEYYHADLCRCTVVQGGRALGRIMSVCDGGAADLLEIETSGGKRFLVPFIEEFVGEVNLVNHTVELKADWLLQ